MAQKSTVAKKNGTAKAAAAKEPAGRKFGPGASEKVGEVLDEMKHGELRSGGNGKKVTDRKQAIAIGLSEARRDGAKVPPNPNADKKKK